MLGWIIESGQRLRLLVVTFAVVAMAFGAWQLPKAPKEMLPEFGPVYVEIQTEALGLSATEVEDLITVPLEQNLLNGVAWLDDILSQSITGLSSIVLIFEEGTDPLRARQMVAERLTQAHMLPQVSKPPTMLQPLSSSSRVIMVSLSSAELNQMQTSVVARWTIRPALMGVPGVANVSIWGHRDQQLQVQIDPQLLQEHGVELEDVIATTGNALWVSPLTFLEASAPGTGGFVDTPNQRLGVQHLLPIGSPDDLALVPIEDCDAAYNSQDAAGAATCPTLGDVATIVEQHQPLIGDSVTTQDQDILLVIEKFPDANTEDVTQGVQATLETLQPGLTGIVVDSTLFQRQNLIDAAMDNLSQLLILGLILAIAVVALIMFDWRSALIAAVSIPLSLVTAASILHLRGETFNTIIIAGLIVALGIVIDDVVVDVENAIRRLKEHQASGSEKSRQSIIFEAILEMRSTMLATTVVILLGALPILFLGGLSDTFFLDGQSGSFFRPLVGTYALAIAASMAVSLIVTPTLAVMLLTRFPSMRRETQAMAAIQRRYTRWLGRSTPLYGLTGAIALVLFAASFALTPLLKAPESIIPGSEDRDLLVTWAAAPGTSLPEMDRITSRITTELIDVPGVQNVSAHVGRAITSDQVVDVHSGEIWVNIEKSADYDRTVASVDQVVQGYPGLSHEVHTYLEDRLAAAGASNDGVVLRIYGQDMDLLRASAEDVQSVMSGIDGITGSRIDLPIQEPQVQVEVDLAAAQSYGLTPGEVRRTAATLVTGLTVGSLFEEQKVFEVLVVGVPEMRHSLSTIENLLVDTPDGTQVRLGDVATVKIVPAHDSIKHEAVSRYVDVVANVDDRSQASVVADLESQLASVSFPLEYHAEVLGGFEEQNDAEQNLIRVALGAMVGMFLVLQAIFGSWRLAGFALAVVPAALAGGIVVTWATDRAVSLGVILGLLAVGVIAVRHTIMLISRYESLEREGSRVDQALVLRGARERLGPILMTTLGTALAMTPFAVMGSAPGLEIVHPMAIVIIGGLVTALIVNLFVVPSLYLRIASNTFTVPASSGLAVPPSGAVAD
jgi:Cu/Ag efflux pump CusA